MDSAGWRVAQEFEWLAPRSKLGARRNMEPNEAIHVESLFSIKGKTALITGGSRGIGLMIARGFLESGAKVYISSRKKDVSDAVAGELSKVGESKFLLGRPHPAIRQARRPEPPLARSEQPYYKELPG